MGIAVGLSIFGGFSILLAQTLTTFSAGDLVSASKLNANFTVLTNSAPPIGSIHAWHKDMNGVSATLPGGWVECNGQTLNDTASALHGEIIPNLNGVTSGGGVAASPGFAGGERLFLRGTDGTTGVGENDAYGSHSHGLSAYTTDSGGSSGWWINSCCVFQGIRITSTAASGAAETRPKSMSIVWVMRVR